MALWAPARGGLGESRPCGTLAPRVLTLPLLGISLVFCRGPWWVLGSGLFRRSASSPQQYDPFLLHGLTPGRVCLTIIAVFLGGEVKVKPRPVAGAEARIHTPADVAAQRAGAPPLFM